MRSPARKSQRDEEGSSDSEDLRDLDEEFYKKMEFYDVERERSER